jgi:hypothetical protein
MQNVLATLTGNGASFYHAAKRNGMQPIGSRNEPASVDAGASRNPQETVQWV